MEIYFDESGNTGSIKTSNNRLNYDNQRHFALCGIVFENQSEKDIMQKKYMTLLEDFNIEGELKGSSLLTRDYNKLLSRFIDEILDEKHFKINIYDKKFYLLSRMLIALTGYEFKEKLPLEFYQLVSSLVTENDEILLNYCLLEESITLENLMAFLEFLKDYSYRNQYNLNLSFMAEAILREGFIEDVLDVLSGISKYQGTRSANLVNLSTLAEFIFSLKNESTSPLTNSLLHLTHDNIDGLSDVFSHELSAFGISLTFADSNESLPIQIADNVASMFYKVINQMVNIFENKNEWQQNSGWILELTSKLINSVGLDNIKFTLPIQNWAVALTVKEMFDPSYKKENRNNKHFNSYYIYYLSKINDEIKKSSAFTSDNIMNIMKK